MIIPHYAFILCLLSVVYVNESLVRSAGFELSLNFLSDVIFS
jgi:hypothetical protein